MPKTIFEAIQDLDEQLVAQLLKDDPKLIVARTNDLQRTPLLHAAEHGNISILSMLLKHGALLSDEDIEGNNARTIACRYEKTRMVEFLNHFDPSFYTVTVKERFTPGRSHFSNSSDDGFVLVIYQDSKSKEWCVYGESYQSLFDAGSQLSGHEFNHEFKAEWATSQNPTEQLRCLAMCLDALGFPIMEYQKFKTKADKLEIYGMQTETLNWLGEQGLVGFLQGDNQGSGYTVDAEQLKNVYDECKRWVKKKNYAEAVKLLREVRLSKVTSMSKEKSRNDLIFKKYLLAKNVREVMGTVFVESLSQLDDINHYAEFCIKHRFQISLQWLVTNKTITLENATYLAVAEIGKRSSIFDFLELCSKIENNNPNFQDRYGNTALHLAAKDNNVELIKKLIEYGVNPALINMRNQRAWTLSTNDDVLLVLLKDHLKKHRIVGIAPEVSNRLIVSFILDQPEKFNSFVADNEAFRQAITNLKTLYLMHQKAQCYNACKVLEAIDDYINNIEDYFELCAVLVMLNKSQRISDFLLLNLDVIKGVVKEPSDLRNRFVKLCDVAIEYDAVGSYIALQQMSEQFTGSPAGGAVIYSDFNLALTSKSMRIVAKQLQAMQPDQRIAYRISGVSLIHYAVKESSPELLSLLINQFTLQPHQPKALGDLQPVLYLLERNQAVKKKIVSTFVDMLNQLIMARLFDNSCDAQGNSIIHRLVDFCVIANEGLKYTRYRKVRKAILGALAAVHAVYGDVLFQQTNHNGDSPLRLALRSRKTDIAMELVYQYHVEVPQIQDDVFSSACKKWYASHQDMLKVIASIPKNMLVIDHKKINQAIYMAHKLKEKQSRQIAKALSTADHATIEVFSHLNPIGKYILSLSNENNPIVEPDIEALCQLDYEGFKVVIHYLLFTLRDIQLEKIFQAAGRLSCFSDLYTKMFEDCDKLSIVHSLLDAGFDNISPLLLALHAAASKRDEIHLLHNACKQVSNAHEEQSGYHRLAAALNVNFEVFTAYFTLDSEEWDEVSTAKDGKNRNIFHLVMYNLKPMEAGYLLAKGLSVSTPDSNGSTPLMLGCKWPNSLDYWRLRNEEETRFRSDLKSPADLNAKYQEQVQQLNHSIHELLDEEDSIEGLKVQLENQMRYLVDGQLRTKLEQLACHLNREKLFSGNVASSSSSSSGGGLLQRLSFRSKSKNRLHRNSSSTSLSKLKSSVEEWAKLSLIYSREALKRISDMQQELANARVHSVVQVNEAKRFDICFELISRVISLTSKYQVQAKDYTGRNYKIIFSRQGESQFQRNEISYIKGHSVDAEFTTTKNIEACQRSFVIEHNENGWFCYGRTYSDDEPKSYPLDELVGLSYEKFLTINDLAILKQRLLPPLLKLFEHPPCIQSIHTRPIFVYGMGLSYPQRLKAYPCYKLLDTKDSRDNIRGLHTIKQLHGVHFKFNPLSPGVEMMVGAFNQLLQHRMTTPVMLLKVLDGENKYLYLASKTVRGMSLEHLLASHPDYIDKIDNNNYSMLCILSLLINPQDWHSGNYIAEVIEEDGDRKVMIRGVDNDIAFGFSNLLRHPSVKSDDEDQKYTMVKDILKFFPQMKQPLSREVRSRFTQGDAESMICRWLVQLCKMDKTRERLIATGQLDADMINNSSDHFTGFPFSFYVQDTASEKNDGLTQVYQKLRRIVHYVSEQNRYPSLTHDELFTLVEPKVASIYSRIREYYPDIHDTRIANIQEMYNTLQQLACDDPEQRNKLTMARREGNLSHYTAVTLSAVKRTAFYQSFTLSLNDAIRTRLFNVFPFDEAVFANQAKKIWDNGLSELVFLTRTMSSTQWHSQIDNQLQNIYWLFFELLTKIKSTAKVNGFIIGMLNARLLSPVDQFDDADGSYLVHLAVSNGLWHLLRHLVEKYELNDIEKLQVKSKVAVKGEVTRKSLLSVCTEKSVKSVLHLAVSRKTIDTSMIRYLLVNGAESSAVDKHGTNVLSKLVQKHGDIIGALRELEYNDTTKQACLKMLKSEFQSYSQRFVLPPLASTSKPSQSPKQAFEASLKLPAGSADVLVAMSLLSKHLLERDFKRVHCKKIHEILVNPEITKLRDQSLSTTSNNLNLQGFFRPRIVELGRQSNAGAVVLHCTTTRTSATIRPFTSSISSSPAGSDPDYASSESLSTRP